LIAKAEPNHRGRFQAQGGKGAGLQESESWAQDAALTADAGHVLLSTLHDKLNTTDQELRAIGFTQAHEYIDIARAANGTGPIKKTFPKHRIRATDGRVDIEVIKGLAFVATPPTAD
jgi:hypothetical protein